MSSTVISYEVDKTREAQFISIDCEFTGLQVAQRTPFGSTSDGAQNLEQEYEDIRNGIRKGFVPLQLGLCPHTWDLAAKLYKAKPYNIYLSPVANRRFQFQRTFLSQASCIQFLLSNEFDLKKCLEEGVEYLTLEEEKLVRSIPGIDSRNIEPHNDFYKAYVADAKNAIQSWLEDKNPDKWNFANISTSNRGQFKLLQKLVRTEFPHLRIINYWDFAQVEVHPGGPQAAKKDEIERETGYKKDMEAQFDRSRVLRRVFDEVAKMRIPIVGHNLLRDLAYILNCFQSPIPDTLENFKAMIYGLSPLTIDTKYFATFHPMLKDYFTNGTSLAHAMKWAQMFGYRKLSYAMDSEFARHSWITHKHQAGYDARDTGLIFIAMLWYIKNGPFSIIDFSEKLQASRKLRMVQSKAIEQAEALPSQGELYQQAVSVREAPKNDTDTNMEASSKQMAGAVEESEEPIRVVESPQRKPRNTDIDDRRSATAKAWFDQPKNLQPLVKETTLEDLTRDDDETEWGSEMLGQQVLFDTDLTANVAVENNEELARIELGLLHENEWSKNGAGDKWDLGDNARAETQHNANLQSSRSFTGKDGSGMDIFNRKTNHVQPEKSSQPSNDQHNSSTLLSSKNSSEIRQGKRKQSHGLRPAENHAASDVIDVDAYDSDILLSFDSTNHDKPVNGFASSLPDRPGTNDNLVDVEVQTTTTQSRHSNLTPTATISERPKKRSNASNYYNSELDSLFGKRNKA